MMMKLHAMVGARESAENCAAGEDAVEWSDAAEPRKGRKSNNCSPRGHSLGSRRRLSSFDWASEGTPGGRGRRPDFLAKCELTTIPDQPPILIGGSGALSKRTFPCTSSNKIQKDARQAFVSGAAFWGFGPLGVPGPVPLHALRLQVVGGRGTAIHLQPCRCGPQGSMAGRPTRPEGTTWERNGWRKS